MWPSAAPTGGTVLLPGASLALGECWPVACRHARSAGAQGSSTITKGAVQRWLGSRPVPSPTSRTETLQATVQKAAVG